VRGIVQLRALKVRFVLSH